MPLYVLKFFVTKLFQKRIRVNSCIILVARFLFRAETKETIFSKLFLDLLVSQKEHLRFTI